MKKKELEKDLERLEDELIVLEFDIRHLGGAPRWRDLNEQIENIEEEIDDIKEQLKGE